MQKSSSIHSINILKTFNYDKNQKAFNVNRTMALSSPCVHCSNHSLCCCWPVITLSPGFEGSRCHLSQGAMRWDVHSGPFRVTSGLRPSISFWMVIVLSSPPLHSTFLFQASLPREQVGAAVGGGRGGMESCPSHSSCPLDRTSCMQGTTKQGRPLL